MIFLLGIIASFIIGKILSDEIFNPIVKINKALRLMASGDIDNIEELRTARKDEISRTYKYINIIVEGFRNVVVFAEKIKSGDYSYRYESFGETDRLGNTLLEMQKSINELIESQKEIRIKEENRNWINVGISQFSNSLRKHSKNIKVFTSELIEELVEYLNVQVGGIYLLHKDKRNKEVLELTAAYAFDRNKFIEKTIMLKEGLVGTCAAEEQIVYLRKVPKDYISITSGLGNTPPQSLILFPLKIEDRVLGVIELGSIKEFEPHHIEFLEKLSDNIALTIASVTINERTDNLVEQLRSNSDELRSQEEELRQNLEELQATQDEASKRQFHLDNLLKAIDNSALTVQLSNVGKIIEINDQFLRLINEHENKIIGIYYNELFRFDKAKLDPEKFWSDIEGGYIQRHILECRIGDQTFYILATFTPLYDIEGNIDKVFMIGYDYTDFINSSAQIKEKTASYYLLERKNNELENNYKHLTAQHKEINESYAIYEGVINRIVGKVVLDKEANILEANEYIYSLLNLDMKNIVGRNLVELSSFSSSTEFGDFWQNLLAKTYYDRTFVYQNKLFKEFYFITKDKVYQNKVYNFIINLSEVAKDGNESIHENSSVLLDTLGDVFFVSEYNSEGTVIQFNEKLLKHFKLSEGDLKRKNHKDFAIVDNVLKYHVLWSKLRTGEPQTREYSY
jgi:methyl-accepting chemotaxis protein